MICDKVNLELKEEYKTWSLVSNSSLSKIFALDNYILVGVLLVLVLAVVTGVKQSQLLVPRLKSRLGTGV